MLDFFYSLAIAFLLAFVGFEETAQTPISDPVVQQVLATESATLVKVVDGDTVKIQVGDKIETIRIIGINTPETVDPRKEVECFGREATQFAKDFFASESARIILTQDPSQGERDKYQRLLGYLSVNGVDYGSSVIAHGYAYEYTYDEPYLKQQEYKQLQENAQKLEMGLWAPDACTK